jgi:ABC-2 type transport system permease protein
MTIRLILYYQLVNTLRSPVVWILFLTSPLLSVGFQAIYRSFGQRDGLEYVVVGSGMLSAIQLCLYVAGDLIAEDRNEGVLELILAAPASFSMITFARLGAVSMLGVIAFCESVLAGTLLFGMSIPPANIGIFTAGLVLLCLTICALGSVVSALFVLVRSARVYQNAIAYPIILLSGVVIPVSIQPDGLKLLARASLIHWNAKLLTTALSPNASVDDAVLYGSFDVVLVVASGVIGVALLRYVQHSTRNSGKLLEL